MRQCLQPLAADGDVACNRPEPRAQTVGASLHSAHAREFLAHRRAVGLDPAPVEVGNDALEGVRLDRGLVAVVQIGEGDGLRAAAVQQHLAHRLRQLLVRRVEIEAVMRAQRLQHLKVKGVAFVPAANRAAGQTELGMGHHPRRVEALDLAEPVASRAGADRIVEGEQLGFEQRRRRAANRAGGAAVKRGQLTAVGVERAHRAFGQTQRGLQALSQTLTQIGAGLDAIDHHLDALRRRGVGIGQALRIDHHAVEPKTHKALRPQRRQSPGGRSAHLRRRQRRENEQPPSLGPGDERIDHLRNRLRLQRLVGMVGAMRRARAGVQQPQVIVNFRHRAYGGARVVAGGLLLDGDGRGQPFDQIDIGLFHQLQKLPRIGRQAFHIAALPLGVQRVERQRRLARTRQPGDDHQLVARQIERDVLQIVSARPAHANQRLGLGAGQRFKRGGKVIHGRGRKKVNLTL